MKFVNLCSHDVVIQLENGDEWVKPPSGKEARIVGKAKESEVVDDETRAVIKIKDRVKQRAVLYPGFTSLPESEEGVWYIVSATVRDFCDDRKDLVSPDSGMSAIKDGNGHVQAVRYLIRK